MKNRKVAAFILTLSLVFSTFSASFAVTEVTSASTDPVAFSDVTDHWGKAAILKWAGNGIINGYEGLFRPDDPITRGEMAVILDNMMDYQEMASNTFIDLPSGQFYTDAVLKANAAGIMKGDGVTVRPTDKITKEEAAIMMSRAFAVTEANSTKAFLDASAVSDWAKSAVFGMEAKGYVSGFGGYFNPRNNITRAEAVTMINNIVKAYYTAAGTYTDDVVGTAVIKVPNVILKGATITENLIIAEGVGNGDATLDSVTVKGETVIRGGGENSVHITGNSVITKVTIEKVGDKLRVVIDDGITISNVEVAAGEEIIITGSVGTVELNAPNVTVYANAAEIKTATIAGDNSTIVVGAQSTLTNVTVTSTADNTTIRTETGAVVGAITASSEIEVSGTGTVTKVTLQAGADGSSVTTPNTATTVPTGVTGVTGGGGTSIPAGSTGTNGASGTTTTVVTTTPTTGGGGGGGSSTIAVTSVTVTSTAVTITSDNGTLQMTAVVEPSNASNTNVTWSVTNGTGYATINSSGLLTAVSNGTVTVNAISVSNGTVSGSLGVTLSNQTADAITTAGATRTSPAVGEPGANASVSASANYTHVSTTWSGQSTPPNFSVGNTPAAVVTLQANTGYTFTGLTAGSVTVAGGTVSYGGGGVVSGGAFLVFTVTYPQLTASITSATATCTSPAIGEAGANAAVSGSADYTHTSTSWSGRALGTFAAGETPDAIVTLTAKTGYGFTGLLASSITVAGGTVAYGAGQGVTAGGASVVFTVTYPQLIGTLSAATVTVTAPAFGVTPPNAAAVEAATSNANYTVTGVTWNGSLTSTGKFKADTAYSATIVLTSKNFYKFQAGAFTPTVGSALSVGSTVTAGTAVGNTATFTASFTTTGALTVSSITVTTQPTQMSYMENAALALNGMVVMETYNDTSTGSATFASGTNANYAASPANGTTLTTAYNGTPVAITHIATGQTASTAALSVASTVSALSGADVALTRGSIVFDYDFTGTSGAITYADALAGPYYLDPVQSTVTLKNSLFSTSSVSVSALGIASDGTVSYSAISDVQSEFSGLTFIPTQVAIALKGATSVNGGANQWTYNINIDLDPTEIDLLTPDVIVSVALACTSPAIGSTGSAVTTVGAVNYTISSVGWYPGSNAGAYAPGNTPAAIIALTANSDYIFTGLNENSITMTGGAVTYEGASQGVTAGGFGVIFTVIYPQLISTVTTAGAVCTGPAIGDTVASSTNAAVSSTAGYTHYSTVWSGYTGLNWVAGNTPSAVITLAAKNGYTFNGLAAGSITVSGGTVSYESGQGVTSGGLAVTFTVTYPQLLAASTPSSIVLAAGSTNGALNISNVSIPGSGGVDSTGTVYWASGTNDKIKFTVTDTAPATSTITINSGAYTSGSDYTIATLGALAIEVTTTEAGMATCVRTFIVDVQQADYATTPGSIVLAVGSSSTAAISSQVVIPAPGATDSSGAVSDWIADTNDRIRFTVTDASGTSTITINGSAYTSGSNYQISTTGSLTIMVTTTEAGMVTAIRTFTVPVTAAPYASTPGSVTLSTGTSSSAAITSGVVIPAPGATDSSGAISDWVADTNDRIRFTVTDDSGSSSITINGGAYSSGSDYQITTTGSLTIVVTTTESGMTTAVRTFTVPVSAAPYATAPSSVVLAAAISNGVGGVTNVALPAAGGTDTTGSITGLLVTTSDAITFTVTDSGSATSDITINGSDYTSGVDYYIANAGTLTIVVTTTESGKTPSIRTFSIAVASVAPSIVSVVGDDSTLQNGNYITVTFDINTNQPPGGPGSLIKAAVDAIVDFNVGGNTGSIFASDYTGQWLDRKTLRITIVDTSGGDWMIGDKISIIPGGNIKDEAATSPASNSVSPASTSPI